MPDDSPITRVCFNYCVPISPAPKNLRIDGNLREWSADTLLPDLAELDGESNHSDVHLAWDAAGLYVALRVTNKKEIVCHLDRPDLSDALAVWIDTRDLRSAHRPSRFCHQFVALPRGGGAGGKKAVARQEPVGKARAQAPQCDPAQLKVASKVLKTGYTLELAIPAEVLNGYAPEGSPRLGFFYEVFDRERVAQIWSQSGRRVGRPRALPYWNDPSLWPTIELCPASEGR